MGKKDPAFPLLDLVQAEQRRQGRRSVLQRLDVRPDDGWPRESSTTPKTFVGGSSVICRA